MTKILEIDIGKLPYILHTLNCCVCGKKLSTRDCFTCYFEGQDYFVIKCKDCINKEPNNLIKVVR